MTSQESGDLFEKASFEILTELFQNRDFKSPIPKFKSQEFKLVLANISKYIEEIVR